MCFALGSPSAEMLLLASELDFSAVTLAKWEQLCSWLRIQTHVLLN
jgi:hypothetical protein